MTSAPISLPADRIERLPKALASAADAIILDLEDGVAPAAKARARAAIAALPMQERRIVVRVNAVATPWHKDDLAMVRGLGWPVTVMLPKAERPEAMRVAGAVAV